MHSVLPLKLGVTTEVPTEILELEAKFRVWGVMIKHKDARGNYPWSPPTNPNPNTSESKEQATHENSSKKTQKSHELQEGDRRNHESFHTLRGQILYKPVKYLNLWSKEMINSPEGCFAQKPKS
jgi:hypothetical protein